MTVPPVILQFTVSHPMELHTLVWALRYADQHLERRDPMLAEVLRRAESASAAADEADRANQLRGGRAAND